MIGCEKPSTKPQATKRNNTPVQAQVEATSAEVDRFCGACHLPLRPESFPRERWMHEVDRGYEFYLLSGRTDLVMPKKSAVLKYYEARAPEKLEIAAPLPVDELPSFALANYRWPSEEQQLPPGTAHILQLENSEKAMAASFLVSDMRRGTLERLALSDFVVHRSQTIALPNPDHASQSDLDGDHIPDFLVSDLGSLYPQDHQRGQVVWLKSNADASDYEQVVLLNKVGRVADAEAADFDGDGHLDVMAAVFGWQSTGGLYLLRQMDGSLRFESKLLDPRHGAIHVCICDLNSDKSPDAIVLFAQEHETVEAFINQRDGTFEKQTVYRAPDPSYGSSGIEVVDFDQDGDQDVLYTNGDTFDSAYVKPYHSVRWIENRGPAGWSDHFIMALPGVHRALAGDLDGDGDLDIAACCFIPPLVRERQPEIKSLASLVWIEREGKRFLPHTIELDNCVHACMTLSDVNADGTPDLVVGNFDPTGHADDVPPMSIWLNQPRSKK